MADAERLLERDAQLTLLHDRIASTRGGDGPLLIIRGPAGIGKTSVLGAAAAQAAQDGITVLQARGGVLERDMIYGVAGQLLERRVHRADKEERQRLLDGPARLGEVALLTAAQRSDEPYERVALNHGLYWLVANLAIHEPLLLLIDDAHWADPASLEFLLHLARRRGGLRVGLLIGMRSDAPDTHEALDRLTVEPDATVVDLPPLTLPGAARLLSQRAGTSLSAEAGSAGYEVTGGNPFFLGEIGAALRDRDPRGDTVALIRSLVPEAVGDALLVRLRGLGDDVGAVAGALAVLGDGATVGAIAAVVERSREEVLTALSALSQAGLGATNAVTGFAHPIVHSAVYGELGSAQRALLHERSARAVAAEGAEPERIAHHLLGAMPAGNSRDAALLAAVGADALRRGDAAAATALLERAAAEPPAAAEVGHVRLMLGQARAQTGDAAGAAIDLRLAHAQALAGLRGTSDRPRLIETTVALTDALAAANETAEAFATLERSIAALDGDDALPLRVQHTSLALFDPARTASARAEMLAFSSLPGETAAQRGALAIAAVASAFDPSAKAADVIAIALRALADGQLVGDTLHPNGGAGPPIYALTLAGELDGADAELRRVRTRAVKRGSAFDTLLYECMRLDVCRQRGELRLAAAHGDAMMELARQWGDFPTAHRVTSIALCWLVDVLIEQGKPDLAEAHMMAFTAEHDLTSRPELVWALQAKAMIAAAAGEHAAALAALRSVADVVQAIGYEDRTCSWRPQLSRALAATGAQDEARALAQTELALCRTWGAPGPLATALRAAAAVGDPVTAEPLLTEATSILAGTALAVEQAKVATDLGIAQRRLGQRTAAQDTLRRAADAATACGAFATAERARAELVILGARPRRLRLSGVDALTPSEHRVAGLAAAGRSNRQIAQDLFVSQKTVEAHLRQVYSKLDVSGRDSLPALLGV